MNDTIDIAAKAIFDVRDDPYDLDEWGDLDATAREPYLCHARAELAAEYWRAKWTGLMHESKFHSVLSDEHLAMIATVERFMELPHYDEVTA